MATKKRKSQRGRLTGAERLIGYCGLYCGDCGGYTGTIANLARDLSRKLKAERFAEFAPVLAQVPSFKAFEHYPQFGEVLDMLPTLRCKKTCRGNGGPPDCEIRKCNREKGLDGCWQCDEFKTCTKLDFLKAGHGDANIRNLHKIQRSGTKAFVEGKRYWRTGAKA